MRKFKIIYKRFKKVWGYADMVKNEIAIDDRAKGKKHLEILIHESVHLLWPDASEEEVVKKSIMLTNTLWSEMYRRVDDRNNIPLQDGTK